MFYSQGQRAQVKVFMIPYFVITLWLNVGANTESATTCTPFLQRRVSGAKPSLWRATTPAGNIINPIYHEPAPVFYADTLFFFLTGTNRKLMDVFHKLHIY